MRTPLRTLATLVGAAALVVVPASAAHAVTVSLTSVGTVTVGPVTCATAAGAGTVAAPPSTAPPSGTVTSTAFSSCMMGFLPMTLTTTTPWTLSPGAGGPSVWPMSVGGVSITARSTTPGLCSFTMTGTAGGTYTLGTQSLAISTGSLVASNVVGCLGLISNGATGSMNATFNVT